jgi:hypothetical protein
MSLACGRRAVAMTTFLLLLGASLWLVAKGDSWAIFVWVMAFFALGQALKN